MRSILNIAHKSLLKSLHDKVFLLLTLFFLIILPSLPIMLSAEGSVQSHLQLYISYSINFMMFFLSILAIFQACNSIYEEVITKQMFFLVTKPVARWKIVVGHWLGITVLISILLIISSVINYSGIKWIVSTYRYELNDSARMKLNDDIFVSKKSIEPVKPNVHEYAEKAIEEFAIKNPGVEIPYEEIEEKVEKSLFYKTYCVSPNRNNSWVFEGLNDVDGDEIIFRFKFNCSNYPSDGKITGNWVFGNSYLSTPFEMVKETRAGVFHDIKVPISAIDENGVLSVSFTNADDDNVTVIFPERDGFEILYPAGNFISNYFKAVLLILCQIMFLIAAGVMFSTFLSFPVACLMTLFVYGIGVNSIYFAQMLINVIEPVHSCHDHGSHGEHDEGLFFLVQQAIGYMISFFPHLDKINPTKNIVEGRFIEKNLLYWGLFVLCGLKGGLFILVGSLIFKRKEIAKVIV